jgi:hypothetical protein
MPVFDATRKVGVMRSSRYSISSASPWKVTV